MTDDDRPGEDPVSAAVAETLARWAAADAEIGRSAELNTLRRHKDEADRMISELTERAAWFESECRRLEVEYHDLEERHHDLEERYRILENRCQAMEMELADTRANLTRVLTAVSRRARAAFGRDRP